MSIPPIQIRLLGSEPVVTLNDMTVSFSRRDALHLLVVLAEERQEDYDRARLSAFFFDDEAAKDRVKSGKLRDAIYAIRKELGEGLIPRETTGDQKKLRVDQSELWVDTADFRSRAQALVNGNDQNPDVNFEKEALDVLGLYRAHFLDDYMLGEQDAVDAWQEEKRNQLAQVRHNLLEQLVRYYIKQGALSEAQQQAESWLHSLNPGPLPLQYLLWMSVTRRQYAPAQVYLAQLQKHEASGTLQFGFGAAQWRRFIDNQDEPLPSLLNLPTGAADGELDEPAQDFVGREGAIKDFVKLMLGSDQPRVMGITGLPGVGKTSFTRQLLFRLRQGKPKYDLVRLELNPGSDFELLLNDVLGQLGMDALLTLAYTVKQRRFKQLLQVRPCLIVIDEGMSRKLSSPGFLEPLLSLFEGARLLLVARSLPDEGFYTFDLPGFDSLYVRQFLARHLPGVPGAENGLLDTFTRTTGGLPLILELVAGFVKDKRFMMASFTEALSSARGEAWTLEDAPRLYGRMFDWLWKSLTPNEWHVLAIVSLFDATNGGAEEDVLAVAGAALALTGTKARQKLDLLVKLGLLQRQLRAGAPCYHLHPIVYDYAQTRRERERATATMAGIRAAYSRHIMNYVSQYSDDYPRLDAQKDNIIRMFASALSDFAAPAMQGEVVALLNRIYDYFDRRGLYIIAEQLLVDGQKVAQVSDFDRVRLLFNQGQAIFKQGRMDDAERALAEAWERAQDCEFVELYGVILRDLGRVSMARGDYDTAVDYLTKGYQSAAKYQLVLRAQIMANLGAIDNMKGQYVESQARFEQILRDLDHPESEQTYQERDVLQFTQNALGLIAIEREEYDQAEKPLKQSLLFARELNNAERIARCYLNLGSLSYHLSDFDAALDYFTQGAVVAEFIQHTDTLVWLTMNKGIIKTVKHQYSAARKLLLTSLQQANDMGLNLVVSYALLWLGVLHFEQAQLAQAQRYFRDVLNQPASMPWHNAMALYGLSLVTRYEHDTMMNGSLASARTQIELALEAAEVEREGLPALTRQDLEKAEADFQRALDDIPGLSRFQIVESLWLWLIDMAESKSFNSF